MRVEGAGVAFGGNFPDALAGGPLLGKDGSVLLLAADTNTSTFSILEDNKSDVSTVRFFGGPNACTPYMRNAVADALGWLRSVVQ